MRSSYRNITIGVVIFSVTVTVSVAGYIIIGETFRDALYMVVITIFSVGYSEVFPVDDSYHLASTILVIVFGCSSLLYLAGAFIQLAMEGEINRAMGDRRMTRGIESLRRHAIICGYGRMGQIMARELHEANYPFVIIEENEQRKVEAEECGYLVLVGDATEESTLVQARVEKAAALASVLPSDAANVFITLSARNLNPKITILARGEVPSTENKLIQAGANHVVLPAAIGGVRLAHMIVRPSTVHLMDNLQNATAVNKDLDQLGLKVSEVRLRDGSDFIGKTIDKVEVEGHGAFLIVAIRKSDGRLIQKPPNDCILEADDTIILLGHGGDVPALMLAPAEDPADSADMPNED